MAPRRHAWRRGCPGPLSSILFLSLVTASRFLASPAWSQDAPACPTGNPCSGGTSCCGQWTNAAAPLEAIHASLVHYSPGDSSNVLVWGYHPAYDDYAPSHLWRLATDQLTAGAWIDSIAWPTHYSPN